MTATAKYGGEFSLEERNLLSVALKNYVGSGRETWRNLQIKWNKEILKESTMTKAIQYYCNLLETKIKNQIKTLIDLLDLCIANS